jgi:4-hydroxythreonine-4-phosphate dehydrogenase
MEKDTRKKKALIGITLGDLNGVGPEVIIKSLSDNKMLDHLTPVIYGSANVISFYRKALDMESFNYTQIKAVSEVNHRKVNVLNCWEDTLEINPGQSNEIGGKYAFEALKHATADLKEGKIDALVTAPINKHNIQQDDFKFVGHTEYLTEASGKKDSLMFLISDSFRIGIVTGHMPLKDVAKSVTKEKIETKLKFMQNSLKKDFGIVKPKIAILGLNPHAGENGLLGDEEKEIIEPLILEQKNKGNIVMGPFPADGFFGAAQQNKYDGILAMYHDQGLIPFKSLAFDTGVNYTAGLPFVRTSPDHGTAYSIAGKNQASETSMRNAIYMALDVVNSRAENSSE